MANGIGRCLREWGINKIFTITVDNASSNDVTVKELSKQLTKMGTNLMNGNHLHVRCMAHIMNLVVRDGLKESSVSIERVRHAVRYVRQSPARLKRFQECFDDEQLNCKKKRLCLDVPTRWNSTYLMLHKAIEFESAFSHYASSEIGLRHYLEHSYIEVGIPAANEDTVLSEMAKKMKENFDKYWGDRGKMSKIIFISCILDPRYKLESVGYALVKMFAEDPGATIQAEVEKYMTSLLSEYVKSSSKGVVLASSSDCSSLDTSTFGLSDSQVSTQNTGLLESLMQDIKKYKSGSGGVDTRTVLDKYFGEETEDDTKEFDVLL
ncbi:zinc finger BED domain-containing protein RICESLEEPER 2-like [Nicotiana tomentosiformis]|uniref:zinc finger BED domain-containing protein RICESLEEPER 2-like n=1 Tax=Nicotiana tomentosiformis TaxID=4098 RepID=UPI000878A605|nr:zinc finger BED domain-containing protein RICESLEEPER 2-like [Nicotiana tomentosiformis]